MGDRPGDFGPTLCQLESFPRLSLTAEVPTCRDRSTGALCRPNSPELWRYTVISGNDEDLGFETARGSNSQPEGESDSFTVGTAFHSAGQIVQFDKRNYVVVSPYVSRFLTQGGGAEGEIRQTRHESHQARIGK